MDISLEWLDRNDRNRLSGDDLKEFAILAAACQIHGNDSHALIARPKNTGKRRQPIIGLAILIRDGRRGCIEGISVDERYQEVLTPVVTVAHNLLCELLWHAQQELGIERVTLNAPIPSELCHHFGFIDIHGTMTRLNA